MNTYQKYDIASKVTLVEEFLTRRQNGEKLTIVAYAEEKQILNRSYLAMFHRYPINIDHLIPIVKIVIAIYIM